MPLASTFPRRFLLASAPHPQLARMASTSTPASGSSWPASPTAGPVVPSPEPSTSTAFVKSPEELRLKSASSVRDQLKGTLAAERSEDWGTRVLKDDADVFSMNGVFELLVVGWTRVRFGLETDPECLPLPAWDHAPPPDDLEERAAEVKKLQRDHQVTDAMKGASDRVAHLTAQCSPGALDLTPQPSTMPSRPASGTAFMIRTSKGESS